jgi:hypothetical protein
MFKGTVSRDFRTLVFLINQSHLGPDSRVKVFSNMASDLRNYSTKSVHSGAKDTAVPGNIEFERLWLPLKGISIKNT